MAQFVYRRCEALRRTLDWLCASGAARLCVFSDGAADEAAVDDLEAVRALVRAIDWVGSG